MIEHSHHRNLPLYCLAVERKLPCDETALGHYMVGSFSVKGRLYHVQIFPDGYLCSCQAAWAGKPCSHGCIASVRAYPELFRQWILSAQLRRQAEAVSQAELYRDELNRLWEISAVLDAGWAADDRWRKANKHLLGAVAA